MHAGVAQFFSFLNFLFVVSISPYLCAKFFVVSSYPPSTLIIFFLVIWVYFISLWFFGEDDQYGGLVSLGSFWFIIDLLPGFHSMFLKCQENWCRDMKLQAGGRVTVWTPPRSPSTGSITCSFEKALTQDNQMAEKHRAECVGRGAQLAFLALCVCFAALWVSTHWPTGKLPSKLLTSFWAWPFCGLSTWYKLWLLTYGRTLFGILPSCGWLQGLQGS